MKEKIDNLNELEKVTLLAMTMESLRGNWSDTIERGEIIVYICDTISYKFLLDDLIKTIRREAIPFAIEDTEYSVDGRVFRRDYNKIWDVIGQDKEIMKKLYNTILWYTSNLSYEELWDDKYH